MRKSGQRVFEFIVANKAFILTVNIKIKE